MSITSPFWRYYGGKWRAAPKYPAPKHRIVIEPFAGAAGYSLRHADRDVILVDRYPVICEIWRWLIGSSPADVRAIPCVESTDDLPSACPEGARYLVGFAMNDASVSPRRTLSAGRKQKMASMGCRYQGWNEARRERVARAVPLIKHWHVFEGSYEQIPNACDATWFVDPPYENAGKYYVHGSKAIDYKHLGAWCRARGGQVIVCENAGASWLPFVPAYSLRNAMTGATSSEVVYVQDSGLSATNGPAAC